MSTKKKIPLRQCVGCYEMKSKKEMIRILKTADEGVIIDTTGRKNGRGAYICPDSECLEKAIKSKGIEKSLKIAISNDVYDSLKEELKKFNEE